MKRFIFLLTTTLLLQFSQLNALTFVVNDNSDDLSDSVPDNGVCEVNLGSGQCTLRAAIESANETPGGPHTVEIPYLPGDSYPVWEASGINAYIPMTIEGTGNGRAVIEGDLFVDGGMLVIGDAITIKNLEFRPNTTTGLSTYGLTITSTNTVQIEDVTIVPGDNGYNIGLLVSGGNLTCNRCEFTDGNSLAIRVINNGNLNLVNSRVSNNTNMTGNQGAGIRLSSGDVLIRDSLIDNNHAFGSGGGIYTEQSGTSLHIINSTISQNKANSDGGGIFAQGPARLENVTITQNTANYDNSGSASGGGIYINDLTVITAKNSIIHGNFLPCPEGIPLCWLDGRNCDDTQAGTIGIESLGWVMVGNDGNCPLTDLTGETNYSSSLIPKLGPLVNLGGLHPIHPIINEGSEADGGDPDGCTFQLDTGSSKVDFPLLLDQRGMTRPLDSDSNVFDGNSCDIGAYEASCFGEDPDGDYVGSQCDVCPDVFDPLQQDSNGDGIGDACSTDIIFYSGFE